MFGCSLGLVKAIQHFHSNRWTGTPRLISPNSPDISNQANCQKLRSGSIRSQLLAIVIGASAVVSSQAQGVIDFLNLPDYANQPVPDYITNDNTTRGNRITDLGATLGRVLFYDRRLSVNDTISCASCHQQDNAFGDPEQASIGVAGTTGRHSMRLINARFANQERFFWDVRAGTLEEQTTMPIRDHVEMGFSGLDGNPDFSDLIAKLSEIDEYKGLFTAVFRDETITEDRMQLALAQFIRSIQSFDSRYDIGRAQVETDLEAFPNFTESENAGKSLYMTRSGRNVRGASCNGCHRAPEFDIRPNSLSNGLVRALNGGEDANVTRSPSLRDIVREDGTLNGPLMHTGDLSIRDMIEHYNAIPAGVPNLDPRLNRNGQPQRLNLTEQEKLDLEAFLRTLGGSNVYTDPKWSDPFDEAGELILLSEPENPRRPGRQPRERRER